MIQATSGGYEAIDETWGQPARRRCRPSGSFVRFGGACVAILAAIISWIIMAEKLQRVNEEYKKPFFITYWVHGWGYSLLYLVWKIWSMFPGGLSCNKIGEGAWKGNSRQLIILSGFLAFVSFASAYSWYYSLPRTNIPANTAIYQAACVWVFLLSIVLLKERVTVLKILAVVISVVGVSLVAVYSNNHCGKNHSSINWTLINATNFTSGGGEGEGGGGGEGGGHVLGHVHRGNPCNEQSTPLGYVTLLFSVITYALFEVSYKKWGSKKGDPAAVPNSARFLGYLGLQTLFWLWPFFLVVHFSGLERFEWPPKDIFILLVWNAFLDLMFNVGLLICIALSSALFASIGTILVIPAAVLVDWIFQGFLLSPLAALGVALIIFGFTGFVVSEVITVRLEAKAESKGLRRQKLQSSVCSHDKEDSIWEEKQPHEDEDESVLLLRNRRRKRLKGTILKYLF